MGFGVQRYSAKGLGYKGSINQGLTPGSKSHIWVLVKIRVPFWVPIMVRHLLFRDL